MTEILRPQQSDLDAIEQIYTRVHDDEEKGLATTGWIRGVYPIRKTAEQALKRDDLFVLKAEGKVVATGIINQIQVDVYQDIDWEYKVPDEEVMVLHTLAVDPVEKGKGYGKAFISFYEAYARGQGCRELRIDTNAINQKARAMYRKLGYEERGIVPCIFNGIPDVQLVCLEKYLDGGHRSMDNRELNERYEFRDIRPEEASQTAEIEAVCFPPNEACSPVMMKERVKAAPEFFLVAVDRETGRIAGFLNGLATDEEQLRDEFFKDAGLHDPAGKNVMLLGLDVLPQCRRQGLARELMSRYLARERARGRDRVILTCLEEKVKMYEKMGFHNDGISQSTWGGEEWYEMSCLLG